jgi:hypothetical protein
MEIKKLIAYKNNKNMDTTVLERPQAQRKTYGSTKQLAAYRQMPRQGHRAEENKPSLAKSAELMLNDYATDKELAAFTQLDETPFYLADISGETPRGEKIERELTYEEEKNAFLYTAKINTAKMLAK